MNDDFKHTNTPLSVAYVIPRLSFSGANLSVLELALSVKRAGNAVTIIAQKGDQEHPCPFLQHGMQYIEMPTNTNNPLRILWNGYRIARLAKKQNFSLIHTTARLPSWSSLIASWICRIPMVSTFHALYDKKGPIQRLMSFAMRRSDAMIAVSNYAKKVLVSVHHIDSPKVHVIHSAPNLRLFERSSVQPHRIQKAQSYLGINKVKKKWSILVPARLTRSKGHLYLLDILSKINHHSWQCFFVGSPPRAKKGYMKRIQKKIHNLGLSRHISLHPSYDDTPALYAVCNMVIAPSLQPESFGRTLVEAQGAECIAISTDHGNATNIIKHNHSGFLIPHQNIDKAADILEQVLHLLPEKQRVILHTAKQHALCQYNDQEAHQKNMMIYQSIL